MSRHLFGWSYPPGAENDPNAPWNQQEGPCAVCGQFVDDCVCPECPKCGAIGDPGCYSDFHAERHGMEMSDEQIKLARKAEKDREEVDQAIIDSFGDMPEY